VAFAPAKPSINAATIANDELENLITYPFNIESVKQLDAAAPGSRQTKTKDAPTEADAQP
jgi:hypothetical protein